VIAKEGVVHETGLEGGRIMIDVWGAINPNDDQYVNPMAEVFMGVATKSKFIFRRLYQKY
jgi:hypothetical protein